MKNIQNFVSKYEIFMPYVLANIVTVVIFLLSYDIYCLLDEYFHTMLFSVLVGVTIKPFKDFFISTLINTLYGVEKTATAKPELQKDQFFHGLAATLKNSLIFDSSAISASGDEAESQPEVLPCKEPQQKPRSKPKANPLVRRFSIDDELVSKKSSSHEHRKGFIINNPNPATEPSINNNNKTANESTATISPSSPATPGSNKSVGSNSSNSNRDFSLIVHIKQIFNIMGAVIIFYFFKGNFGVLLLLIIFVAEYITNILWRYLRPYCSPYIRKFQRQLESWIPRQSMRKTLSKTFTYVFVFGVVFLLVASTLFSVYMLDKDFQSLQHDIRESKVSLLVDKASDIFNNSSMVKLLHQMNLSQEIQRLLERNNQTKSTEVKECISKGLGYLPDIVPKSVLDSACSLFYEIEMASLQNYLSYAGKAGEVVQNLVGFSFSHIFGVINSIFLFMFKCVIFLTTTYYIVEDFDVYRALCDVASLFSRQSSNSGQSQQQHSFAREFSEEIKYIMTSSIKIGLCHFLASWILMDLFEVTRYNFFLSMVLSLMSMIPLYQPYIGAIIIVLAKLFLKWNQENSKLKLLGFLALYYLVSAQIFHRVYSKIKIPMVFTSLAVLLGIYAYGVMGVIYGPLIVVVMKRVINQIRTA